MRAIVWITALLVQVLLAVELPELDSPSGSASVSVGSAQRVSQNAKVSVLCYHDFTARLDATEMRIRKEVFTQQMKKVKDRGINVISLKQFIAWRRGELQLPAENVLITIDDGWRSVYQVAFPVLKQFGYPFVLGIYTDFVANGGLSLDDKMVREMMAAGMEISSHSVSHPFASGVKQARLEGEEAYATFLTKEFGQSQAKLEKRYGQKVETYIYPGGYYTTEMFPILRSFGYEFAFSVKPGKVTRDSPDLELPRYVVLGTGEQVFNYALDFNESSSDAPLVSLPYPVKPEAGKATADRLPWIGVDLSSVPNVDRESVYMRVGGFGKVEGTFIPNTSRFEWQATRPLRSPSVSVIAQWKLQGKDTYEPALKWSFYLDHQPNYIKLAAPK